VPSSTSSSETAATQRQSRDVYLHWSVRAILCLVLLCAAVEAVTRLGFSHISRRIESRTSTDYKAALAIRHGVRQQVLIVGNSLMLEGIDYPLLRESLSGHADALSFPIEQTQYFDWYYGLRRLFADGSQPDVVVMCMSAEHLVWSSIRGDYSAYYLFLLPDIPQVGRDVHYDLTKTSSLVLARFSLFYAGRGPLRNFVLVRTDPAYAEMLHRISTIPAQFSGNAEMERIAEVRLGLLRDLCAAHGARFIFLLAPGFGPEEPPLVQAGELSHTDVLVPFHLNELSRDKFRDSFHLNATGAQMFTVRVAELLKSRLQSAK